MYDSWFYLLVGSSTLAITTMGCALALRLFPRWGLVDKPHKYGLKRNPIPYFGGLIIWISFLIGVGLFGIIDNKMIGFLVAVSLLTTVNFLDDKHNLHPIFRLGIQMFCIAILIFSGIGITHITNPFGGTFHLDAYLWHTSIFGYPLTISWLGDAFTMAWILLVTNTMNWLDGLSGLVSGISAQGGLILFFLSISPIVNQPEIATLALILGSIALAFCCFDFHPAKILMGDTGSMFLGFTLGVLAILSSGKIATAFLIMGFPILDALWVIVRRIRTGQSPFKGDLKHFHHRLLQIGLSARQTLILIYCLCGVFGMSALFLNTWGKFVAIVTMFVMMMIIGGGVVVKGKRLEESEDVS